MNHETPDWIAHLLLFLLILGALLIGLGILNIVAMILSGGARS